MTETQRQLESWDSDPTQLDPKFHALCCLLYNVEEMWHSYRSWKKVKENKKMPITGGAFVLSRKVKEEG